MNILLINTNPVVSRLISLCMRDEDTVFEELTDANLIVLDRYDIVFVDDASYVNSLRDVLANLMIRKKVFLSSKSFNEDDLDYFDDVIKKPFLPSQITAVLESLDEIENDTEEIVEEHFIFPLATETKNSEDEIEPKKTEVLDSSEIERIKALIEEDDTELESVETLSKKPKKINKEKKTKSKKKKDEKKKEDTYTFEEALIAAVEGMKVKKIKKLLKGAEVTIKINFKDKK